MADLERPLRAGFMGSPEFAVPSLRVVASACDLRVVVCQPDRPAGRGRQLRPPAVKEVAEALGVAVLQPRKMKDGTLCAELARHDLEVIVVAAFGRILPAEILALPRWGCLNVHGSVLPRWRGAAPVQRAILAGDTETGVTIMAMDEGLDTGAMYTTGRTVIGPSETSGELMDRLAHLGAETLARFLVDFPDVAPPRPQDDREATYAPPLRKEEGRIDWRRPATVIVDHVRGMDPWPGAFTHRGGDLLKLFGATVAKSDEPDAPKRPPGSVVRSDKTGLYIAALNGVVAFGEVQPAGKRRMNAAAYVAGKPFADDDVLSESRRPGGPAGDESNQPG